MAKYRADPSPSKVDLGVGVYRDLSGNTPVLACVRRAEQAVLAAQTTKSYVAAAGREEFNSSVAEMVLRPARADRTDARGLWCPPGGRGTDLRGRPRHHGSRQRPDVGQSHALAGRIGPAAGTLPLLRCGRAPAALRRDAGAP